MIGDRIRQARELVGLTQQELAKKAAIAQSAITQIESGAYEPSDSVLQLIAMQTGFDISFLKQERPPAEFPVGSILFRTQKKVSPKDKARAHRMAQLMFDLVLAMRARLKPIPVLIPRLSEFPQTAAELTRNSLGLSPETPIPNLINSIERAGVLVLELPLSVPGLDGFSAWVGINHDTPVICLLSGKQGYRRRFTAAEEIGHLVMHFPLRVTLDKAEEEAKQFAGELILPEEAMRTELIQPITLSSLGASRLRWQASLQFLMRRASDLQLLTYNQYRYLMMQVSTRGWRTEEPGDAQVVQEKPKAFFRMVELVYGSPPDYHKIRKDLGGAPTALIRSLLGTSNLPDPKGTRLLDFKSKASC